MGDEGLIMGREHELKTWPRYFSDVLSGKKTFELRKDDRGFDVGDILHLREFDPKTGYTGRECRRIVTYILRGGCAAIPSFDGYVIMSLADNGLG